MQDARDDRAVVDARLARRAAWQTDYCLQIFRSVANFYASRRDDYDPPLMKAMSRRSPAAQARSRTLTDDELRRVWAACDEAGAFGGMVKIALLTAQRRDKVVTMRWSDIEGDIWVIATQEREKGNATALPLPQAALDVIHAQPRLGEFVFASGRGAGPLAGFSKLKARLDRLSGVSGDWTLHDLRRTSRSLMSRAGVSSDHAERVMGHAIPGVEGVYDRHEYSHEKGDALARLAALLASILDPPGDNVIPLARV
jgi:integrase